MDLILPNEDKIETTNTPISTKRIVKMMVQYVVCNDLDTGEYWIENYRCFNTSDSFAKRLGFKHSIKKPKPKELTEFIDEGIEEV